MCRSGCSSWCFAGSSLWCGSCVCGIGTIPLPHLGNMNGNLFWGNCTKRSLHSGGGCTAQFWGSGRGIRKYFQGTGVFLLSLWWAGAGSSFFCGLVAAIRATDFMVLWFRNKEICYFFYICFVLNILPGLPMLMLHVSFTCFSCLSIPLAHQGTIGWLRWVESQQCHLCPFSN